MLFVSESSNTIFFALLQLEEDNYTASNVYSKLLEIHNEFIHNNNQRFDHVIKACTEKLEKYLFNGGMPSMKLLKAIRILDPLFFKLNNVNFDECSRDFPELNNCLDEMAKYKLLCEDLRDSINIKEFWSINKSHLPKLYALAKVYLHFPISTASVERSFSKYNNLLANDRLRLKQDTIRSLIYLYYNKNVSNIETVSDEEEEDEEVLFVLVAEEDSMSGVEELE